MRRSLGKGVPRDGQGSNLGNELFMDWERVINITDLRKKKVREMLRLVKLYPLNVIELS